MSEYHAEERRKNMGKEECTSFKWKTGKKEEKKQ